MLDFRKTAIDLGELVVEKRRKYGGSNTALPAILNILYPEGIAPDQYGDLWAIMRIIEKICRRVNGNSDAAEDWRDIGGHAVVELTEVMEENNEN